MNISIFFKKEQRARDILVRTSGELSGVREFPKILSLVTNVLTEALGVNNTSVYFLDKSRPQEYVSRESRLGRTESATIKTKHPIITCLKRQGVLVYDDTQENFDINNQNIELRMIILKMRELSADVILPCALKGKLWSFIVLGKPQKKKALSADVFKALLTLADQTAVAVSNSYYIEAKEHLLKKESLKKRRQSLDHMAVSMAHEINNPLQVLLNSLYFIKNFVLNNKGVTIPKDTKKDVEESLDMSSEAVGRIGEIVKAVINYSQLESDKLQRFSINAAVKEFYILIQPQVKEERVHFIKQIECDLPLVLGDQVLCEEVLMNFVINALHAVQDNEEKKIFLKIFRKNEDIVRIECMDNGYGIEESMLEDVFLPSTTTKGLEEGAGLGLYRVRKIVEVFQGKVWAESKGRGQGARFVVELPVYKKIS